jgi:hypothetical protein
MNAGLLILILGMGANLQGSPAALWIEGEAWFSQVGSHGPDRPPYASRGECLGNGWGGRRDHEVAYRFELDREWPAVTLELRYARRDPGPARLTLIVDDKPVGGSLQLPSTGGWGHLADKEWQFTAVPLGRLSPGWHRLQFVSAADKNNVNLDGFFLTAGTFQPPTNRQPIEAYPRPRIVRGPDAPGPDCMSAEISLERFCGRLDDWYYPSEEPAERARLTMPRVIEVSGGRATLADGERPGRRLEVGASLGEWRLMAVLPGAEPSAVVEREFDRWGLILFVNQREVVAEIRKAVGRLEKIARPQIRFPVDYFDGLLTAQEDMLGSKVLAKGREPSFGELAGYLAPLESYTFLGNPSPAQKFIVYPDGSLGTDLNRTSRTPGGRVVFDPAILVPKLESTASKRGLLGGYLPAIDYGYFDSAQKQGHELCALAQPGGSHALVRIRQPGGPARYWRTPPLEPIEPVEFYKGLLALQQHWSRFFDTGMRFELADRRALDVARGCLARALSGLPGDHPKYGMGSYWGQPEHHDGFPPTTLSLCRCLLDWGFADEARRRLGYYLDHFVKPDGTLLYYGPAVAEYGQLLDLVAACVRRTGDQAWLVRHRPAIERLAGYLVRLLAVGRQQPADALTFGLIRGSAEADTHKDQQYYFSGNAWCWRGLWELSRLYAEIGRLSNESALIALAERWSQECQRLRGDLARSVSRSVIPSRRFVPPIAGQEKPFERMTESTLASYTNYRYWLETLSARCLEPDQERLLLDYRQTHGGELLATTRFASFLDDWPFFHQALGMLEHDRIERYLLGYWAHIAHHQSQGTFTAYEGVPIRGWRERRHEADYCVPSELTASLMTRWMLVSEERDADVLWLGRAIPRPWLGQKLAVEGALTRWGPVGFRLEPSADRRQFKAEIRLAAGSRPTLMLRVRHPSQMHLDKCSVIGGCCERLDAPGELVRLRPEADRLTVTLIYRP